MYDPDAKVSIIDGGDLLYQTSLSQNNTYGDVCVSYVRYLAKKFTKNSISVVINVDTHVDPLKTETHACRDGSGQAVTNGRKD